MARLIQRGKLSFQGLGPTSIVFPRPFVSPPTVEITNTEGREEKRVPYVVTVSKHQFVVKRRAAAASDEDGKHNYGWIAEGEELDFVEPETIALDGGGQNKSSEPKQRSSKIIPWAFGAFTTVLLGLIIAYLKGCFPEIFR
jgi:hypothetical protein